jgi:hypothetical protein
MNKFKDTIRKVIQEGEVVPFRGGNSPHRWTVKYTASNLNDDTETEQPDLHSEVVDLPNNPKLKEQHIQKLMHTHAEVMKDKYPETEGWNHSTNFTPMDNPGSNHGTHWIDNEDGKVHVLKHYFNKED